MKNLYHRLELGIGLACLIAALVVWRFYPTSITIPIIEVFKWTGILVLGQSLIRDLVLLAFFRASLNLGKGAKAGRKGLWICVESTAGAGLVGIYLLLFTMGAQGEITAPLAAVIALLSVFWLTGYAVRDLVLELKREPNHLNLVLGIK